MVRWLAGCALVLALISGCSSARNYSRPAEPGRRDLQDAAASLAHDLTVWSAGQHWQAHPLVYFRAVANETDQRLDAKDVTDRIRAILRKQAPLRFVAAGAVQDADARGLSFQDGRLADPVAAERLGRQMAPTISSSAD